MRSKIISILLLLIALSLLTIGIIEGQYNNIYSLYDKMVAIP